MIKKQVTDPVFPQCPIRNVLARIGDLSLIHISEPTRP